MARGIKPEDKGDKERDEERDQEASPNSQRRSRLRLPLNNLAVPFITPPPSREMVEEGGSILFRQYLQEEIQQHQIPEETVPLVEHCLSGDNVDVSNPGPSTSTDSTTRRYRGAEAYAGIRFTSESAARASTPEGYKKPEWRKYGRTLREMADSFAQSKEGETVRHQANGVDLNDISEGSFLELLLELFRNGISTERVIALFYFCSTLIIRAATNNKVDLTKFLFIWSLRFIKDRVCDWVYKNGGWENVLTKMSKAVLTVALIVLMGTMIGCGIVYIRKNW